MKTDGIRCLLYCTSGDGGAEIHYLIDRKNDYYYVPDLHFPVPDDETFQNFHVETIIDGELVNDRMPNGELRLKFLVFDCLVLDGNNLMHRTLDKRLGYLEVKVYKPYKELYKRFPDEVQYLPFLLEFKKMELSYGIEMMFRDVMPNLPHGNDGLIFTARNQPYLCGTDEHMLKWKPEEENSIDFRLNLEFPMRVPSDDEDEDEEDGGPREARPDWSAKPAMHLSVFYGDGENRRYGSLYMTDDEWERMKGMNRPLEDTIVECNLDEHGRWRFLRFRDDKHEANHISTVESVMESIRDRVGRNDLLGAAKKIKDEWKRRSREAEEEKRQQREKQEKIRRAEEERKWQLRKEQQGREHNLQQQQQQQPGKTEREEAEHDQRQLEVQLEREQQETIRREEGERQLKAPEQQERDPQQHKRQRRDEGPQPEEQQKPAAEARAEQPRRLSAEEMEAAERRRQAEEEEEKQREYREALEMERRRVEAEEARRLRRAEMRMRNRPSYSDGADDYDDEFMDVGDENEDKNEHADADDADVDASEDGGGVGAVELARRGHVAPTEAALSGVRIQAAALATPLPHAHQHAYTHALPPHTVPALAQARAHPPLSLLSPSASQPPHLAANISPIAPSAAATSVSAAVTGPNAASSSATTSV